MRRADPATTSAQGLVPGATRDAVQAAIPAWQSAMLAIQSQGAALPGLLHARGLGAIRVQGEGATLRLRQGPRAPSADQHGCDEAHPARPQGPGGARPLPDPSVSPIGQSSAELRSVTTVCFVNIGTILKPDAPLPAREIWAVAVRPLPTSTPRFPQLLPGGAESSRRRERSATVPSRLRPRGKNGAGFPAGTQP